MKPVPEDTTQVVRTAVEKAAKDFTERVEQLGFKQTKKMLWARRSWRRQRSLQPSIEGLSFKGGMSVLTDSARSAIFRDGQIIIALESGAEIRFSVAENPRLARGTAEQLSRIELSPYGIHWPELDEELSFRGLLRGDHGQHQNVEPDGAANGSQPIGPE
jgi:hypothetical protein